MRKVLLLVVALVAALSVATVAHAINGEQGLEVKINSSKAGTKKKPRSVSIDVITTTAPAATDGPFATKQAVIHFDKALRFNTKLFKSCTAAVLQAQGPAGCPKGSQVGGGSASATAVGQAEDLTITAFNGPKGKLELLVRGDKPLVINSVIEATLAKDKGKYGYKLIVPIPDNLQQPLQGVVATLTRFETKVKATVRKGKKKVGYVETTGCKGKTWHFAGDFTYTDGTSKTAKTTTKCK
jgi:hypothetical protein